VLALSLMAIFSLNSGAVNSHAYTKKLTVATLLARSKMTDLEQELYDQGFPGDDDEKSGDFSDEGFANFKWRAKILAPKTDGVPPEKMLGALFNLPIGAEGGGDGAGLSSLFTGGGGGAAAGAGGGLGALGPAAGLVSGQFNQMVQSIAQSVREVHLVVTWKHRDQTETLDLVTHVVSLGPGSDRNGGGVPMAVAGGAPGGAPGGPGSATGPGGMPGLPQMPSLPGIPGLNNRLQFAPGGNRLGNSRVVGQ
jgi:general secretion pathway protein I